MKFGVAWWNTHLSAGQSSAGTLEEIVVAAAAVLSNLVSNYQVQLIFLGEINQEACTELAGWFEQSALGFVSLPGEAGAPSFNFAIAARPEFISFVQHHYEYDLIAGERRKIALRTSLELTDGTVFSIFSTHWPSRLYAGDGATERSSNAQFLRQRIDRLIDEDANANVIVLGDFNDNPFDYSVSKFLQAARDVNRVRKHPRLLYNPFWRELSPVGEVYRGGSSHQVKGTYYHRSGKVERWHTFDQILVSSSLVSAGTAWHLDERATTIIDQNKGFAHALDEKGPFDHYPVVASFERMEE